MQARSGNRCLTDGRMRASMRSRLAECERPRWTIRRPRPRYTTIRPFRIDVPQADLDDLHDRWRRTRWPDDPAGLGWSYGPPGGYLRELADYWRTELRLARGRGAAQRVPAVHHRDRRARRPLPPRALPEPNALPLLLTHGWAGSIVEFLDADRSAHRSPRARRRPGRRVPRRDPVAARVRVLRSHARDADGRWPASPGRGRS